MASVLKCAFCGEEEDGETVGELLLYQDRIAVHQYCLVWCR